MASLEQPPDWDDPHYWGTPGDPWWCYLCVFTVVLLLGALL